MSTSTAITTSRPQQIDPVKKKAATFRQLIDASKDQIATALPRHLDADKMIRVVMTSLQKNPALMDCDQRSVIGAVIEASQLGLMPDGILGEAYLVPYKGKCQLQPGYRGLISLARRSGEVSDVYAELVFTCDEFKVTYGLNKILEHVPNMEHEDYWKVEANGDMPTLKGAYAVVVFKDGTRNFVYMPRKRLNQIRATSQSLNSSFSPWKTAVGAPEMFRKCPIRQLAKMLPLSTEFQKAAMLDEYADAGVIQGGEFHLDPDSEAARLATDDRTKQLADKYGTRQGEDVNQDEGPDPAEESQEPPVTMSEALAEQQQRMEAAQRQANETGEPVRIQFLGATVTIDPEPNPNPSPAPAEQSVQPQASTQGTPQESQKSEGSRHRRKTSELGLPGVFDKP